MGTNIKLAKENIKWLPEGDVSIACQVKRYLLGANALELSALQARIAREGWGRKLLKPGNLKGTGGRILSNRVDPD